MKMAVGFKGIHVGMQLQRFCFKCEIMNLFQVARGDQGSEVSMGGLLKSADLCLGM
jgi:hypothetical protein